MRSCIVHILDYVCKGQRHVARSTFAAELLSAGDPTDQGLLLAQQLHEMLSGPVDATDARELRLTGGFAVPMVLIVDAKPVFAAVIAMFIRILAEKSLLCHVQFIRELLDRHVLHTFAWFDTRDMIADRLTKGAVERTAIHSIMDGTMNVVHEPKVWTSRKGGKNIPETLPANNSDEVWFTFFSDRSHSLARVSSFAYPSPSLQHPMAFATAAAQQ